MPLEGRRSPSYGSFSLFLILVFGCLSSNLDQVRSGVGLLHANPNWKERDGWQDRCWHWWVDLLFTQKKCCLPKFWNDFLVSSQSWMIGGVIIHPYDNDDVIAGQVQSILNRDKIMRCTFNLEREYKYFRPGHHWAWAFATSAWPWHNIGKKNNNRNNLLFLKLWTLRPFCFLLRFRSLEEAWRQELLWPPKISLQTAGMMH